MYNLAVIFLSALLLAAAPAAAAGALPGPLPAASLVPPVSRTSRLSTVSGDVKTFPLPHFLGGRRVWVYLPPGYAS